MSDKDFLLWLHARLENVVGINPSNDYMIRLKQIAEAMPEDHRS